MKNYQVLKDGDRYTIGRYDEGYKAYIVNDGICNYYWWPTEEAAQAAADAYNAYDEYESGPEYLGEHGNDNDRISLNDGNTYSDEMVELYRLFNALDDEDC